MNFSNNLKKIRKSLKLSQAGLAKLVDISQRTISHYEKGDSEPELIIVCRLADAFNITVDHLYVKGKSLYYEINTTTLRYVIDYNITIPDAAKQAKTDSLG